MRTARLAGLGVCCLRCRLEDRHSGCHPRFVLRVRRRRRRPSKALLERIDGSLCRQPPPQSTGWRRLAVAYMGDILYVEITGASLCQGQQLTKLSESPEPSIRTRNLHHRELLLCGRGGLLGCHRAHGCRCLIKPMVTA